MVEAVGPQPGERFDLFGGLSIGPLAQADVRIDDRYASARARRIFAARRRHPTSEDMGSTNGT